ERGCMGRAPHVQLMRLDVVAHDSTTHTRHEGLITPEMHTDSTNSDGYPFVPFVEQINLSALSVSSVDSLQEKGPACAGPFGFSYAVGSAMLGVREADRLAQIVGVDLLLLPVDLTHDEPAPRDHPHAPLPFVVQYAAGI